MSTPFIVIFLLWAVLAAAFQPVDINHASSDQIALLPGVGKRLAENIASHRKKRGAFSSLSDLEGIAGMTTRKLDQIKGHVVFGAGKNKLKATVIEPPEIKRPLSTKPVVDFAQLFAKVLAAQGLEDDLDQALAQRVRRAGWLPQLSTYVDTDHGEIATKKALSDPLVTRGGRDLGFGIKARFDLDRLIYNDDELDVAKLAISRQERRDEVLTTVRKHYFRYLQIASTKVSSADSELAEKLNLEMAEIVATLDAMSKGFFSDGAKSASNGVSS